MRDKICKAKSIMTDEWIEGYYARKGIDEKTYKHYILEPTISVTGAEYNDVCFFVEIEVDEETVSEFTGLMDKNDTKIFENDIISAHPDELFPDDEIRLVVEWHDYGWFGKDSKGRYTSLESKWVSDLFEVIGNRIDNPELLKGE